MWGGIARKVIRDVALQHSRRIKPSINLCGCRNLTKLHANPTTRNGPRNDQKYNYKRFFALSSCVLMAAAMKQKETDSEESKIVGEGNRDIALLMMKGQKMLREKCSFEKVETVYTEALHLALSRKDHNTIAYVQDQLANLCLRFNQLEKAEKLFKHVIRNLLDGGIQENDRAIIEISLKLATIYAGLNQTELAISGYNWVVETTKSNLEEMKNSELKNPSEKDDCDNQLALLGMALDSYGRYHFAMGRSKEALEVTREAKDISIKLFGENDVRTLVLYNDIGAILTQLGNFDEATEIIEKAIAIATKSKNIEHGDLAVFWVNLGGIFNKQDKKKKTAEALEKARKEAVLSKDKFLQKQIEVYIRELGTN